MSAEYAAYNEALMKAGAIVAASACGRPATLASVRVRNGKTEVLDGPYADTQEQLGGYYIIEVRRSGHRATDAELPVARFRSSRMSGPSWCMGLRQQGYDALHDADPPRRGRPRQGAASRSSGPTTPPSTRPSPRPVPAQRRRTAAAGKAATTVRSRDGKTDVLDGPYADTKEQFAGYFFIDVADLDEAIAWANRCPSSQIRLDRDPPDLADAWQAAG